MGQHLYAYSIHDYMFEEIKAAHGFKMFQAIFSITQVRCKLLTLSSGVAQAAAALAAGGNDVDVTGVMESRPRPSA